MPTKKQAELLIFIHNYMNREKASPTFKEMMAAMKYKSMSNIDRLISALEYDGFIYREKYRHRSIEILRFPDYLKEK